MLIGAETRRALPEGSLVEALPDLRVKGKQDVVEAYLLHALPTQMSAAGSGARRRPSQQ